MYDPYNRGGGVIMVVIAVKLFDKTARSRARVKTKKVCLNFPLGLYLTKCIYEQVDGSMLRTPL